MVAADSPRGARDRVRLQHQVPAAPRRRDDVLPGQRRPVSEFGIGGVRARVDRGALHLPGRESRGPHVLAAAVESDVHARATLGEVLGWNASAPDSGAGDRRSDGLFAQGHSVHDGRIGLHDHVHDARCGGVGDGVRDVVSAVRHGERRADPDVVRRLVVHDELRRAHRRDGDSGGAPRLLVPQRSGVRDEG